MNQSTTESQEPKARFKVGDKVRVKDIGGGNFYPIGHIGVVETIEDTYQPTYQGLLKVSGVSKRMFGKRLELVVEGVDFTKTSAATLDLSRPVTTRDGRKVRILCTDLKRKDSFTIAAVICDDPALGDFLKYYRADGTSGSGQTENELINPPVKKYINLFKNDVGRMYYATREDAEKAGKASNKANPGVGYIRTIEVEL